MELRAESNIEVSDIMLPIGRIHNASFYISLSFLEAAVSAK